MIVMFGIDDCVTLDDAHDFTAFKAVSDQPRDHAFGVPLDMGVVDLGREHVWIEPDWLIRRGPDDPDWRAALNAMQMFASSKGWTDGAGRIRAHIEYRTRSGPLLQRFNWRGGQYENVSNE